MNYFFRRRGKVLVAFITLGCLLAALPALAATRPDTGSVLEGAKPPAAQPPAAAKGPVITVDDRQPATGTDGQQKIPVQGFRLGGEPPLPEGELLALVKGDAGRELSLGQLNTLAGKITQYLRHKGYPVAFAYIPAQDIKDGVVEVAVVPGKYGRITVTGSASISPERLKAMLFFAKPGAVITQGPLERGLLLLSDVNGISVKATLAPGEAAGTADLNLDTADTAKVRGALYADNWGNRYTGRDRYGVQLVVANLRHAGDDLSLGGLITENSRMNNYNFGYSVPVANEGARAGVKHSRVSYTLGETFADLGATGRATVTSYDINYPLIRGRAFNLYGTASYEDKHLRDDQTSTASYSPKTSRAWNFGLAGNFADGWLGGGNNTFSLTHSRGRLTIKDAATAATDDATAKTAGSFGKTLLTVQRQQYVAVNLNLHLNFTGQLADRNLDSAEKLFLGGADGVRAFPQGEASGDQGYRFTGEMRWRLPGWSAGKDNVYLAGFYDYGSVMVNKHPWAGAGNSNRRSLMGAGLGLLWTRSPDFAIRCDYAWKIGQERATAADDRNGRLWLQGVKYF